MRRASIWCMILLVPAISAGSGCNRAPQLVPVEGTVTLDGQPLADATVVLSPLRGTDPGPFVGTTNSEGRFALGLTNREERGVAVGEYGLIITTVPPDLQAAEGTPATIQREVVPAEYRSGLKRITVTDGGMTNADFELKTR